MFCTIAKMVCHRHCTMFSVMFQTKTWLKAERGTTSQEQIEKWSCLSSNGPLNVLLIISISAELLLLCTLWGKIYFEVTIKFLHYCIENEIKEANMCWGSKPIHSIFQTILLVDFSKCWTKQKIGTKKLETTKPMEAGKD